MEHQGTRTLHAQLTRMNLVLVLATALLALAGTLVITLRMEHQSVDLHLTESARIISQLPQARQALEQEQSGDLAAILDEIILQSPEIDLILIGDTQGCLYYSKDHALIGATYGSTAYHRTIQGEAYVVEDDSLEKADRCAFAPVYDADGIVLGFAAVGIYTRSTLSLTLSTLAQFLLIAVAACALGLLLSSRLSRRIKAALMGYEPEDFRRLFHRQQEVLDALEEGIVAIDRSGTVIFINESAARLLRLSDRLDYLGRPVQRCDKHTTLPRMLRTGKPEYGVHVETPSGGQVLSDHVPIRQDGKVVGAVAIFRDRREVTQMAEDLTGVQHMVEAMRAYTHEFMNKLHVIHGLLQLKKYEMAQTYIMEITKTQQQAVSRVMNQIENPMAAAPLVGQTSRAAELGIRLVLDPGSHLSRKDQFLPSAAFVSILGNLITNAMDSLNHAARRDKEITVSIRESEEGLLLCVEDTGPGVDPAVLPHMFENGVSTKGEQRGTGLSIVKELTDLYHGQIRVESHRGVGAAFYVTFHQAMEEAKA